MHWQGICRSHADSATLRLSLSLHSHGTARFQLNKQPNTKHNIFILLVFKGQHMCVIKWTAAHKQPHTAVTVKGRFDKLPLCSYLCAPVWRWGVIHGEHSGEPYADTQWRSNNTVENHMQRTRCPHIKSPNTALRSEPSPLLVLAQIMLGHRPVICSYCTTKINQNNPQMSTLL